MIQEAYVSYEIAKLLKEKGFNEKCRGCYHSEFDDNDNSIIILEEWTAQPYNNAFEDETFLCSAPTHQMAMAWLREVHKIFIEISVSIDLNGNYHYSYFVLNKNCEYLRKGYTSFDWTYEEAVEASLKYCLENLI